MAITCSLLVAAGWLPLEHTWSTQIAYFLVGLLSNRKDQQTQCDAYKLWIVMWGVLGQVCIGSVPCWGTTCWWNVIIKPAGKAITCWQWIMVSVTRLCYFTDVNKAPRLTILYVIFSSAIFQFKIIFWMDELYFIWSQFDWFHGNCNEVLDPDVTERLY